MTIVLDTVGRRIYLRGDTYPMRDRIRAIGGHWDAAEKAWWIGAGKREAAEALVSAPQPGTESTQAPDQMAEILFVGAEHGADDYLRRHAHRVLVVTGGAS